MAKLTIVDLQLDQELDRDAMRDIAGGARGSGRGDLIGGLGGASRTKQRGPTGSRFAQARKNRLRRP